MPSNSNLLLQASALTRKMGDTAVVDNVSLSLRQGDILGLLGLNGAGKSTTLKMLAGVLTPDSGDISIAGYPLDDDPIKARQRIGFLPDQPPVYPEMTVAAYLRFCAKLRRVHNNDIPSRCLDVLEACELTAVAKKRIGKLSKGFQQRVGLAQALIHHPAVVLLDEPSNGLDPQQMQSMRDLIAKTAQTSCVVFSTHLLSEVTAVCNRIAVMHNGRVVHDQQTEDNIDTLQQLFNDLVQQHSGSQAA
jgi:ABC-2 type transport system ATP-binding protein